jgi:hypothetical protein
MDADNLLARLLELCDELARRFGTVYGVTARPKHRTEALLVAFERLARETSPRLQPADLSDDEVVKSLARAAARISAEDLYVLAPPDASEETQHIHDVANVVLEALAECGRRLGDDA